MQYRGAMGNFPIILHQDYLQRPPVRSFKIVGDQGIAALDLIKSQLTVYNAEGEITESWDGSAFKRNDMFLNQMKHFLASVAREVPPQVNLWDGMQSMRLALAAKESLAMRALVIIAEELEP
jgi:predicted dehydrogenase